MNSDGDLLFPHSNVSQSQEYVSDPTPPPVGNLGRFPVRKAISSNTELVMKSGTIIELLGDVTSRSNDIE